MGRVRSGLDVRRRGGGGRGRVGREGDGTGHGRPSTIRDSRVRKVRHDLGIGFQRQPFLPHGGRRCVRCQGACAQKVTSASTVQTEDHQQQQQRSGARLDLQTVVWSNSGKARFGIAAQPSAWGCPIRMTRQICQNISAAQGECPYDTTRSRGIFRFAIFPRFDEVSTRSHWAGVSHRSARGSECDGEKTPKVTHRLGSRDEVSFWNNQS